MPVMPAAFRPADASWAGRSRQTLKTLVSSGEFADKFTIHSAGAWST